jgi:arylsulfatase
MLYLFFCVFPTTTVRADQKTEKLTNVVLITLDTTRPDHLGCYGYKRNTTPHIDQFAEEAVVVSRGVSVIPLTTPSHATIMTGLHPQTHQIYRNSNSVHDNFTMLAEILNRYGYSTGGFVSVKLLNARLGFAQGFDYYSDIPEHPQGKDSQNEDRKKGIRQLLFKPLLQRRGDETVDAGLAWLEKTKNQRFFAWIHLYDPHLSYMPPTEYGYRFNPQYEEYLKGIRKPSFIQSAYEDQVRYDGDSEQLTAKEGFQILFDVFGINSPESSRVHSLSPGQVEDFIAAYDGEIAFVDEQVKRVIDFLKSNGLYSNTIVIIMGDHGEILHEKEDYFGHHKYLYEGAMRIPIIMKFPGITHQTIDERITNMDVLPTLLDAIGIEVSIPLDGISYWPVISSYSTVQGPEQLFYGTHTGERRASVTHREQNLSPSMRKARSFSEHIFSFIKRVFMRMFRIRQRWRIEEHFEKIAVVKGDWKLIRSNAGTNRKNGTYELYNIKEDPYELENLVADENEVFAELSELLEEYARIKRFSIYPLENGGQTAEEIKTLRSLGYM